MEGRVSRTLLVSMLLAASATLYAADQMKGPVSGLLVDRQTHSIRHIIGIAGYAYAGGNAVTEAEFALGAPEGRTALVGRRATLFAVGGLDADQPAWRNLGESKAPIESAAWSADAQSLAVYFPSASRLRMWTGIQDKPEPSGEIDLSLLEGRVAAIAVAQDGRTAFAVLRNGESGALYMLRVGQTPRLLQSISADASLAAGGTSVYASDRGRNEVIRIQNWDSNVSISTVATAAHGVASPVGIAVTTDGSRLLIANGEARQVLAIYTKTSAGEAGSELDFTPTKLQASGKIFLLADGEAGQRPAQVIDPSTMTVHFVPIPALAAASVVE